MRVEDLRRIYENCREETDVASSWIDPEVIELVLATARFVLEGSLAQNEREIDLPDEKYLPLKECAMKVKVVGMRTYIKWLTRRPDFARLCARKIEGRWHFYPEGVIDYVKEIPMYRNRLALI